MYYVMYAGDEADPNTFGGATHSEHVYEWQAVVIAKELAKRGIDVFVEDVEGHVAWEPEEDK